MRLLTSAKNIVLNTDSPVHCPDPSEYRPELLDSTVGKDKEQFRTYDVQVCVVIRTLLPVLSNHRMVRT